MEFFRTNAARNHSMTLLQAHDGYSDLDKNTLVAMNEHMMRDCSLSIRHEEYIHEMNEKQEIIIKGYNENLPSSTGRCVEMSKK